VIIRRLRARAALYLAICLFLGGWSLTAMATQPVLESHMKEFVYWTFGVGAFALLGAAGAFVSHLMARMEKSIDASIARLEKTVEILGNDLIGHNASPFAHTAAGEHNHGPMNEQSNRIEGKVEGVSSQVRELAIDLHDLKRDHDRVQSEEGSICTALAELRKRDPKDSPKPRRASDSGTDYTPLRGKNQ
jgi:hypothetical protein